MPTLTQKRAAEAYDDVFAISQLPDATDKECKEKYGSLARGLPAMIQINGMGPSLAFLLSKAKGDANSHHMRLFNHISSWLCGTIEPDVAKPNNDFLDWMIRQDTNTYRLATQEAIQFSMWLRRYAEAFNLGEAEEEHP